MTNPASIYDEEALTALELAARTAKRVNDCIGEVNQIDDKTAAAAKKETQKLIDNGTFDEQIGEHLDNLNERVDNLLGSVKTGSTTLDAEVIDLRVGADGTTYPNAGESFRKQVKKRASNAVVFMNEPPEVYYGDNGVGIKFNKNAHVYINSTMYEIAAGSYYAGTFNSSPASLFTVLFNTETSKLTLQHHVSNLPENNVVIGFIYEGTPFLFGVTSPKATCIDSRNPHTPFVWTDSEPIETHVTNSPNYDITINFPTSLNVSTGYKSLSIPAQTVTFTVPMKTLYRLVYDIRNKTLNLIYHGTDMTCDMLSLGFVHMTYGVLLNGCAHHKAEKALTLAPLIMGHGNNFVLFDSESKTVTFPTDTLIQVNRNNGLTKHYQLNASTGLSVSWVDKATSALIVVFDTSEKILRIKTYSETITPNEVAIATLRTNGSVSILAPYKWDGKPFNLNFNDYVNTVQPEAVSYNVKSVNHRGYNPIAPENTLAAFKLSAERGFRYVECDVQFTKDGVPVLLHDATIDRTSNGTGSISALTFDEVRSLDFGTWKSPDYAGEKIPSLEEFLILCRAKGLHPYIEIKVQLSKDRITLIDNLVKRCGMNGNVTYISSNSSNLFYMSETNPKTRLGLVTSSITSYEIQYLTACKTDYNEIFFDMNISNLTTAAVDLCVSENIGLEVWTVNSETTVKNLDPYITGVTSDSVHSGGVLRGV